MRLCLFVAADDLSKTAIIFEQIIIKSIDKLGSLEYNIRVVAVLPKGEQHGKILLSRGARI